MDMTRRLALAAGSIGLAAILALPTPAFGQSEGPGFLFHQPQGTFTLRMGLAMPNSSGDPFSFFSNELTLRKYSYLAFDLAGELRATCRIEGGVRQLLQGAGGDPLRVHGQELASRQTECELDHLAAYPHVALQHLGREVAKRLLQDVLACGAARRAAGDHAFESLEAGARLLLDRLPRGKGRAKPFDHRLGLRQALSQLCGLRALALTARLDPVRQLGDVAGLPVGAPDQAPDQAGHSHDGGQEAYKEEGEQEFEQRHLAHCSPGKGYRQAC